jgi:hypothetical protein
MTHLVLNSLASMHSGFHSVAATKNINEFSFEGVAK